MAKLPIIIAPDPRLKAVCAPIERVDGEMRQLMDDMLDSMYAANGIGLAAPQVGIAKRVIVIDAARKNEKPAPHFMANPEIVWESDEMARNEEGCLSFPEHYAEVTRPSKVRVSYLGGDGKSRELEAEGLLATCVQHEMDHLDGVVLVDHLSPLKRSIVLRKLTKMKKADKAAG